MGRTASGECVYVATMLETQFGPTTMEIVATHFLVDRLLTEFERQTGGNVHALRSCLIDAFHALSQQRGISRDNLSQARQSFEYLTERMDDTLTGLNSSKV